ncbi:MAG: efflux RND transporter periplasmic adaptor subunit, partial [Fidelibacterota bacterium]
MFRKLMIASLFILSIACNGKPENSPETETGTNVEVVTVEMEFSNSFLEFSGVLQPISQVDVFPEVPGKIERIISVEGDLVQKGDILAIIEKTDYQIGYDQALAAYALAKANWSNAKANYSRQVELNQDGFSSEANLEGAETAYKIAQAQLDQSEAAMQLATRQLERTKITSPIDGYISMRTITP